MKEEYRPRLTAAEMNLIEAYREGFVRSQEFNTGEGWDETGDMIWRKVPKKGKRVLVVGDLHSPFVRSDYLPFLKEIRDRYKTNHTVFIGDLIDNHYMSFWDTDPDGLSAGDELEAAIDVLQPYHTAFPNADVILGNHDIRIYKQMFKAGISSRWLKRFSDVLNTPTWNFVNQVEHDGVIYVHGGVGGGAAGAINRAVKRGKSVVQGHHHTESHLKFHVTDLSRIFAMQIGCGIDEDTYASAYAKNMISRFIMSCGVVLDDGQLPIIEPMRL